MSPTATECDKCGEYDDRCCRAYDNILTDDPMYLCAKCFKEWEEKQDE